MTSVASADPSSVMNLGTVDKVLTWLSHDSTRPLALTQWLLQRAERSGKLGVYIHIAQALAVQQAQQVGSAVPSPDTLPLRGLPLVVKDNIDVAGMPTTSGSHVLKNHIAQRSASAMARLTDAGAVVLGKVNLHELCFGITSNNAAFGPVRNPYAPTHITGGSSGGTAAAIAAGLAPAGIGSDTGGSLRIPAALCGVVGFRPTTGRWPSDGVVKISTTRDTLGPMGRTVADCALLDAVACNTSPSLEPVSLQGVRIGVPKALFWQPLDSEVHSAAHKVLARLQAAGVILVDCDVGIDEQACTHAGMVVAMYESLACLEDYMRSHGLPFNTAQITQQIASPDVRGIFQALLSPQAPDSAAYHNAIDVQRPAVRQAYADCFAQHGIQALIFPTTPLPATPIGQDDTVVLAGQIVPTFLTYARNTAPGSFAGQPGISLPMGCTAQGLPMGIALDGAVNSDRQFLALAQAIQAVLEPMPKPPEHF